MSTAAKILGRMRNNPRDWRIEDLIKVAESMGISLRRPGSGSSHVVFGHPASELIVTVPSKRPIKPVYVKQFLALVDAAGGK